MVYLRNGTIRFWVIKLRDNKTGRFVPYPIKPMRLPRLYYNMNFIYEDFGLKPKDSISVQKGDCLRHRIKLSKYFAGTVEEFCTFVRKDLTKITNNARSQRNRDQKEINEKMRLLKEKQDKKR